MKNLTLEPCVPPIWAKTGHAQTLIAHFMKTPFIGEEKERLEVPLPDGDRLVGYFIRGTSDTTVSLFHGLSGTLDSGYMHRTARVARKLGHSVFMVNHRGCGIGAGFAKKPYHSGRGEDIAAVVSYLRAKQPGNRQIAIGFSLGANALLTLMTGLRGDVLPDAAIAVNAPIHLEKAAIKLKQGFNRIYDLNFLAELRRDVLVRHKGEPEYAKMEFPRFGTLHDFDNWYTAKHSGFRDREDYYATCSTHLHLSKISVPTVIITSEDDPFVSVQPYLEAKVSPAVRLHVEKFGGHLGYLTRKKTPFGSERWLDYALHETLKALNS